MLTSEAYAELEQAVSISDINFFSLLLEDSIGISPSEEEISELDSIGYLGEVAEDVIQQKYIETITDEDVGITTEEIKTAAIDKLFQFIRAKELL
jgi:hypothetical protein